jgi:hypothetical protein
LDKQEMGVNWQAIGAPGTTLQVAEVKAILNALDPNFIASQTGS